MPIQTTYTQARANLSNLFKEVTENREIVIIRRRSEEICNLFRIGKNSYGRWERGESEISPSMNLLVHQLIERFPEARVNLIESEMRAEIEKARMS